ncbi:MAG: hypothetical protein LBK56_04190 [Gracilibacteraceae bacterium]|jgi:hypothetical protein|nr:hypothetical protein [Gracilibacteraceae bacterium]
MKNNRKGFVILSLLALCVILAAGVFMLGQSPKGADIELSADEPAAEVTLEGISGPLGDFDVPVIQEPNPSGVTPDAITSSDAADAAQTGSDIPLTTAPEKPGPPEPPAAARQDEQHELPDDPALTNPDVKPDQAPKPAETAPPDGNAPNAGDKNGNGEIYIPGFGWVKDEGGGGQGQKSDSDGDWEKIIGY